MQLDFSSLTSEDVLKLFDKGFVFAINVLAESIFGNQKYDSIDSYNMLFDGYSDNEIQSNALTTLDNWDPSKQLGNKYGQDCYDVMFKLLEILPESVKPRILATKNTEHIAEEQQKLFKYYHFSIMVADTDTKVNYLLDWINRPIKLVDGNAVKARGGDVITVKSVDNNGISLTRDMIKKKVIKPIDYELIGKDFDIVNNFKSFLRVKNRDNKITKYIKNTNLTVYMRYRFDLGGFETNIENLGDFVKSVDLKKRKNDIDANFQDGVADKLINFVHIHKNLPNSFWL